MKKKSIKGKDFVMKFLLAVDYIRLENKLVTGLVLFLFKKLLKILGKVSRFVLNILSKTLFPTIYDKMY